MPTFEKWQLAYAYMCGMQDACDALGESEKGREYQNQAKTFANWVAYSATSPTEIITASDLLQLYKRWKALRITTV